MLGFWSGDVLFLIHLRRRDVIEVSRVVEHDVAERMQLEVRPLRCRGAGAVAASLAGRLMPTHSLTKDHAHISASTRAQKRIDMQPCVVTGAIRCAPP